MPSNKPPTNYLKEYKNRVDGYHKMEKDLEKKDTGMTVKEMVDKLIEDLLFAQHADDITEVKRKLVNRIKRYLRRGK